MIWLNTYDEAKLCAIELMAGFNNYITKIDIKIKYRKGKKYFVVEHEDFTEEELDEIR